MPITKSHVSKENRTTGRSSMTPSKLNQSEASVTHVLANKGTDLTVEGNSDTTKEARYLKTDTEYPRDMHIAFLT